MESHDDNMRFQLLINGKPTAIAGIDRYGVLTLIASWVRRDLREADPDFRSSPEVDAVEWAGGNAQLHLGGRDSSAGNDLKWHQSPLMPGNEITLRVLGPGAADPPLVSKLFDSKADCSNEIEPN